MELRIVIALSRTPEERAERLPEFIRAWAAMEDELDALACVPKEIARERTEPIEVGETPPGRKMLRKVH